MIKYRKPHHYKREKPIFKNRSFWFWFFLIVVIVASAYFFLFSDFFKIKSIVISGNQKVSKESILRVFEREINKESKFFNPKNIFLFDSAFIIEDVLANFPQIDNLETKRKLPETLTVFVTERKGLVVFSKEKEIFSQEEIVFHQSLFLVDGKGVVFEELLDLNNALPKIKKQGFTKDIALGEKILEEDLISKVLKIDSLLTSIEVKAKEFLVVDKERLNIITSQDWQIYFNLQTDINWQLEKLKAVLEKDIVFERRADLDYIDLRFGNLAPFKYKEEAE